MRISPSGTTKWLSDSANDKGSERYLIVAAIIALVTIFAPATIIGTLYGWHVWDIEGDYLQKGIRLVSITFLIAITIMVEVSRRKHPTSRKEGYAMAEVIILIAIIINAIALGVSSSAFIPNPFVHIEFRSVSVAHTYTVTINFVNTGATSTKIASVLLNGVPYNDSGWAGTVKPAVAGNLTLNSVIDVDTLNTGTLTFSDDCVYIPSGYSLTAGVTVRITIHMTRGWDFDTSVTLP